MVGRLQPLDDLVVDRNEVLAGVRRHLDVVLAFAVKVPLQRPVHGWAVGHVLDQDLVAQQVASLWRQPILAECASHAKDEVVKGGHGGAVRLGGRQQSI